MQKISIDTLCLFFLSIKDTPVYHQQERQVLVLPGHQCAHHPFYSTVFDLEFYNNLG